jgi:HAD superfamily hydrolase (TIGR01509 family)
MTTYAVLLDMDGVLVDSAGLHVRAYEKVFEEARLRFSDSAREAVLGGATRSRVIEIALPTATSEVRRRLWDAKPRALGRLLEHEGDYSMKGAKEMVAALVRAGVPMAVVTNSRAPHVWLRNIGIADQIHVVITGDDVSSPKPSPEGYLLGALRLGVAPNRCLAIEDSRDGWLAATAAGMDVALFGKERPAWLDSNARFMSQLGASNVLERSRIEEVG